MSKWKPISDEKLIAKARDIVAWAQYNDCDFEIIKTEVCCGFAEAEDYGMQSVALTLKATPQSKNPFVVAFALNEDHPISPVIEVAEDCYMPATSANVWMLAYFSEVEGTEKNAKAYVLAERGHNRIEELEGQLKHYKELERAWKANVRQLADIAYATEPDNEPEIG